jgi:hypothetical protein
MAKQPKRPERALISISMLQSELERFDAICAERGQSRVDFIRSAIEGHKGLPIIHTKKPLSGASLTMHLIKLRREERAAARAKKRKSETRKG